MTWENIQYLRSFRETGDLIAIAVVNGFCQVQVKSDVTRAFIQLFERNLNSEIAALVERGDLLLVLDEHPPCGEFGLYNINGRGLQIQIGQSDLNHKNRNKILRQTRGQGAYDLIFRSVVLGYRLRKRIEQLWMNTLINMCFDKILSRSISLRWRGQEEIPLLP